MATGIAFVGCGYVADLYMPTLSNWSDQITLCGVYDKNSARAKQFSDHHKVNRYATIDELLQDEHVAIVLNLTNPDQHYAISRKCLEAGKHVFSEKPLALDLAQARDLVVFAEARGLQIASAPSTVLGPTAQALLRAVKERTAGQPRLVYAELDDGMVHRIGYENWVTASGARWPAQDEFATGCTLEHAGYALTWLVAMFGPVREVVSSVACLAPDKGPQTPPDYTTPDFSVAVLTFDGGIRARVTNSIIATHDHSFRVFCDDGVLSVDELWNVREAVKETPILTSSVSRGIKKLTGWQKTRRHRADHTRGFSWASRGFPIDFALGPAEMAKAIAEGRESRLAGNFALHITEVSLAIQHPERFGTPYVVTSSCEPMVPMPIDRTPASCSN